MRVLLLSLRVSLWESSRNEGKPAVRGDDVDGEIERTLAGSRVPAREFEAAPATPLDRKSEMKTQNEGIVVMML